MKYSKGNTVCATVRALAPMEELNAMFCKNKTAVIQANRQQGLDYS